jgi:hypothetical protein
LKHPKGEFGQQRWLLSSKHAVWWFTLAKDSGIRYLEMQQQTFDGISSTEPWLFTAENRLLRHAETEVLVCRFQCIHMFVHHQFGTNQPGPAQNISEG